MIGPYKESNKYKLEQEVATLRAEVARLTRVAQGNFDANTNTLSWTQPLIATLRARVAALEHAIRSLLDREDFWRNAGTLPGEYDNLVDALKETP